MSLVLSKMFFLRKSERAVYASTALLKKLKIKPQHNVRIRLGDNETKVTLKATKRTGLQLYVPESIRKTLGIPRRGNCYVVKSADNELRIGPLIGILTASRIANQSRPFGSKSASLRRYILTGHRQAYCFAFSPKDVNWQQNTVTAHFVSSSRGWVKRTIPLPDVVYNRITNRTVENSNATEAFKNKLSQRNIPIFNWDFFDKWQVYHLLRNETEALRHVPESHINPSSEQIKTMLEKHKFIYLKPTSGYMGIGIYRITRHPRRGYFIRYRKNGKNVLLRFSQFQHLMRQLNRQSRGRLQNYVAQQGIRLIELDQCPLDFRFHLNKDKNNEWVVAGVGAKKAGRGSVTTHVRSGGQLMTPQYVLNRIYGEKEAEKILEKAKKATILLAKSIERNYSHNVGELGFDIGIDKKGHIWMFEANSKPGRSIFRHPGLRKQGSLSHRLIFEHCVYLSGFLKSGGDE